MLSRLSEYGPYFTDRYRTPWGLAVNLDGPHSDHVRWFFIHNALQWIDEFHIDGLRVDAVHAIVDHTAEPFLQDLTTAVRTRAHELGRRVYTIAETDLNDPRVITPAAQLGLNFDSQWDRLSAILSPEKLRLAAAAIVLSPFIPMLFMGEEFGETAPWQYFTSHADTDLIEAVRKGRLEEFDDFAWKGEPPDPDDVETFNRSKLNRDLLKSVEHASLRRLYKELMRLRRETPSLRDLGLAAIEVHADDDRRVIVTVRGDVVVAFNFSDQTQTVEVPVSKGGWKPLIESGATVERGRLTLSAFGFALLESVELNREAR